VLIEEGIWQGWEQTPAGFQKQFGEKTVIATKGFFYAEGDQKSYWALRDVLADLANSPAAPPHDGTLGPRLRNRANSEPTSLKSLKNPKIAKSLINNDIPDNHQIGVSPKRPGRWAQKRQLGKA
jgi:hypothetical protein